MPQKFIVTFSRNPVVVLILVAIPLIAVALFLSIILTLASDASDWVIMILVVLMMLAGIGGMLTALRKWGMLKAEVIMDDVGIEIHLLDRSPFYLRRHYAIRWEGLENLSSNIDPQHKKRFYQLSFRQPATTVTLSPADVAAEDTETPFGEALLAYADQFNKVNSAHPDAQIKHRGFYDSWWAKVLTGLAYIMSAAVIAMRFITPEKIDTWRVIQVTTFSALWLAAYHANRRHRKAQGG